MKLKILGKATSINVRKVLWTCAELGLDYELEAYGSGFKPTETPEFRALNPNAMVPVLLDGDFVLWESNTICRYLVTRYAPGTLLPEDAAGHARVEQWMDWQGTELNNAWRYAFMSLVRKSPAHQDAQALAAGVANWHRHMTLLDEQLQRTGSFAAGAQFSLADVVLGLSTHRWMAAPLEHPELPAVQAYYERLSQRPGFMAHGRNGIP
ncbi:MAG: glutathione S-transferase [Burkholderiaceae bacterium]|nr:glutathione S-transferase [Burkholderiaceae bacterium]